LDQALMVEHQLAVIGYLPILVVRRPVRTTLRADDVGKLGLAVVIDQPRCAAIARGGEAITARSGSGDTGCTADAGGLGRRHRYGPGRDHPQRTKVVGLRTSGDQLRRRGWAPVLCCVCWSVRSWLRVHRGSGLPDNGCVIGGSGIGE